MRIQLLLQLVTAVLGKPAGENGAGLYGDDDFIEILDYSNFQFALGDTSQFWVVEFYAAWCGHCQHFAPYVKSWAAQMQNWGRIINFGVIDCGNSKNSQTCSDHGITGYPTIKYYPLGPRDLTAKNTLGHSFDVNVLIHETIEKLAPNIQKKVPVSFVNLNTTEKIDNAVEAAVEAPFALVVDKKPDEGLSQAEKLVAELSTYNGLHVAPAVWENVEELEVKFNVVSFPSVVIIRPNLDPLVIAVPDFLDLSTLTDTLSEQLNLKTSHNWSQQKHIVDFQQEIAASNEWQTFDQTKVHLRDIESGILHLLFYDVNAFPLDGETLATLVRILATLSDIYPRTSSNLKESLTNAQEIVSEKNEIKKQKDWLLVLTSSGLSKIQGPNPDLKWAACSPSETPKRGYPCGLWSLFHFLLANSDDTANTITVIVELVTTFFGCSHCVDNFKLEIEQFPFEAIQSKEEGVLWLWRLHNSVNKRLAGDESEDVAFPKVQFPTADQCSLCHRISDSTFDEEQVASFLIHRNEPDQLVLSSGEELTFAVDAPPLESIASNEISSYTGVIWMFTIAVTVIGLWIYKQYRVKFILKRNYRKFYHQL